MSAPDYLLILRNSDLRPRIDGFPHRVAVLPEGTSLADLGHQSGAFLIEPDCAHEALNDPALIGYLAAKMPVLFYGRRARDLRPILRRSESFQARGYAVEVLK